MRSFRFFSKISRISLFSSFSSPSTKTTFIEFILIEFLCVYNTVVLFIFQKRQNQKMWWKIRQETQIRKKCRNLEIWNFENFARLICGDSIDLKKYIETLLVENNSTATVETCYTFIRQWNYILLPYHTYGTVLCCERIPKYNSKGILTNQLIKIFCSITITVRYGTVRYLFYHILYDDMMYVRT